MGIALIAISLIAGGIYAATHTNSSKAAVQQDATDRFSEQSAPLSSLAQSLSPSTGQRELTVNGQFSLNGIMLIQPSAQPSTPVAGQIYYDQQRNQVGYYDGKGFVYLQGGQNTTNNYNSTTVNNYATPVTNLYTTTTNVTNVSGGSTDSTAGTAGNIAMFTAPNTLGNSLIVQSGSNLSTGTGIESVVLGSTNGASTAVLQGGTGGVSINTGSVAAGASGDITIMSGADTATGSGNVTIDAGTGTVQGTVVDNFTFESGITGWDGAPYGSAIAQSNAEAHSGSFSLAIPLTLSSWASANAAGMAVTPGHTYHWSAWLKANGGPATVSTAIFYVNGGNSSPAAVAFTDSTAGWTQASGNFIDPVGTTLVDLAFVYQKDAVETHYIDDVTMTDLSGFSGTTVSLGATNAEAVNIGNSNQIGATTVTGGNGVTVDGGIGILNMSANDVEVQSTANSNWLAGGNLTLATADANAASGNITIQSGASSTTASGNVDIDAGAGIVTGTVLRDDGFETDLDGINPWILPTTVTQDCTQAHTGSCSLAANGSNFWGILQDGFHTIPVTAGHHFFFSAWVKAATGGANISGRVIWNVGPFNSHALIAPTVTTTTAGWTQMSITGTAPAGATTGLFEFNSPDGSTSNGVQYIDDAVLTDLSSSSAVSELDLGAANAQILTLGNMSEIGATTINGGSGITMNAGLGDFDINGGAININGSGASTLATSDGSLTVSAVDTSDWGLGNADNADGGNLTVHSGNPGAPGYNGGNLTLAAGSATANGTGAGGSIQFGYNTNKVGYTAIGGTPDSNAENAMSANKITPAANGTVRAVSFYIGQAGTAPNNKIQVAIYDDSGGACGSLPSCPGNLIESTTDQTVVPNSWNTVSTNFGVLGGMSYWVAWNNNATNSTDNEGYFDSNGLGNHIAESGQTYGIWPATFPTGGASTNTTSESLYLDEAISGGVSGYAMTTNYVGRSTFNNDVTVASTGSQAFQVQDATGTALLTADTTDMAVTVKALTVSTNLTVNGHIITGGSTPGIAAGTAACTTPTVGMTGDDTSGSITITTGSGCAAPGTLATVTFATAFGAAPNVTLTPGGSNALSLGAYVDDSTASMTTFDIGTNTTPADATTYRWNYLVTQ